MKNNVNNRNVRVTTYLDENTTKKLELYDNKSRIVKEALNKYFLNKNYFVFRKKLIENNLKEYENKIEHEKIKLEYVKKQLADMDRMKNERPKNYMRSIYTLKCLPNVTEEDLVFQAERLSVDVGELKEWISIDDYYDEIFSKKKSV